MGRPRSVLGLILLLSCIMLLSQCDDSSADTEGVCGDGLTFELDADKLCIFQDKEGEHTYRMYDYFPGRQPWYGEDIYGLVVDSKVQSIGDYAFYDLRNLFNVSISDPSELKSIGDYAFSGTAIQFFRAPDSLEKVGQYAFSSCKGLSKVELGVDMTQENFDTMFDSDFKLTDITIDQGNNNIKNIQVPEDKSVFSKDGTILYKYVYGSVLKEYTLPDSVRTIETRQFSGAVELTLFDINNATVIGDYAFAGCESMISFTGPDAGNVLSKDVTSVGVGAFVGCLSLFSIDVDPGNEHYSAENGILYDKDKTVLVVCPQGCQIQENPMKIPYTVTEIQPLAFYHVSALEGIDLHKCSITKIGDCAFQYTGLQNIHIPDTIKYIGDHAFMMCPQIRYADIGAGLEYQGTSLFVHSPGLFQVFDRSGQYREVLSSPIHAVYRIPQDATVSSPGERSGNILTLPHIQETEHLVRWLLKGGEAVYLNGDTLKFSSTAIIEQSWDDGCTVVFDSAGGSDVPSQRVHTSTKAVEPSVPPVREGYHFMYWANSDGKVFDFNRSVISNDTVLTAKWSEDSYLGSNNPLIAALVIALACIQVAAILVRYMHRVRRV